MRSLLLRPTMAPPKIEKPKAPIVEKPLVTEPVKPPVKKPTQLTDDEKFLTEKRPYDADDLIKSMQEMEDMMDEMHDLIRSKFKK